MQSKNNKKICFAASSGGHFEQLMMLKDIMSMYDSFILAERTQYNTNNVIKTYYLEQINRKEKKWLLLFIKNTFKSLKYFLIERPDVVICTGALAMVPMCLLAKMFGKKLIFIESFAKVTSPTETGKLMYKLADRFYVQWESMLEVYPNAIFLGGIY